MVENRQFEELHEQRTWRHGDPRKAWAHIIRQGMLDHQERCSPHTEVTYGSDLCWEARDEIETVGHALLDPDTEAGTMDQGPLGGILGTNRAGEKPDLSPWNQTCSFKETAGPQEAPLDSRHDEPKAKEVGRSRKGTAN